MRTRMICFVTFVVFLTAAPRLAVSQPTPSESKTAGAEPRSQKHYYKLDFVLRETDEGKVLNQRAFILNINAEPVRAGGVPPEWWNVRSGTRIPVPLSKDSSKDVSYIDVGVNLDVRAEESPEGLQLQVTSEVSSVGSELGAGVSIPAIRQVKVRAAVLAPVGKTTTVFTADDPSSKHRFELDVTPVSQK